MKCLRVTMQRLGQRQAELLLQRKGTAEETATQNWEHLGKNVLKERGGELSGAGRSQASPGTSNNCSVTVLLEL